MSNTPRTWETDELLEVLEDRHYEVLEWRRRNRRKFLPKRLHETRAHCQEVGLLGPPRKKNGIGLLTSEGRLVLDTIEFRAEQLEDEPAALEWLRKLDQRRGGPPDQIYGTGAAKVRARLVELGAIEVHLRRDVVRPVGRAMLRALAEQEVRA